MGLTAPTTGTPTPGFPTSAPTTAPGTLGGGTTTAPTQTPPPGASVVYWEGMSGDRIMIQYTGNGSEDIVISADPNNTGETRTKTVTLTTTMGTPAVSRSFTVTQQGGSTGGLTPGGLG